MSTAEQTELAVVVLQPTPFCNVDCSYCYLGDRDNRARMSIETVRRVFAAVFTSRVSGPLRVLWHAGEPLVVPVSWYAAAYDVIESMRPSGLEIKYHFQTNGTLLDDEWAIFLKASQASTELRVSVDGPMPIHDTHRRTRRGRGTFNKVSHGIAILNAHRIPFGVLTVLTYNSLNQPEEMFRFYQSIDAKDITFNFEEIEGANRSTSLVQIDSEGRYRKFLKRFITLMRASGCKWSLRQVDEVYRTIFLGVPPWPGTVQRGAFLNVDWKGDFSTFSPELLGTTHPAYGDFCLGNIYRNDLIDTLSGPKARFLAQEIHRGVELCREECEYFNFCGSRFPSNKLFENGSFASTETINCRLRIKATVDVIMDEVSGGLTGSTHTDEAVPQESEWATIAP
jgi:uncharacterized protein